MRNTQEAKRFLREAQHYLDNAIQGIDANDVKKPHHCMARVRECLTEANLRLRPHKAAKPKAAPFVDDDDDVHAGGVNL